MMTSSPTNRFITRDSVVALAGNHFRVDHKDGSTIIMSIQAGKYFTFNEMARSIWDRLDAPISVESLIARLGQEFSAKPEVIETDVLAFLEKLSACELIKIK